MSYFATLAIFTTMNEKKERYYLEKRSGLRKFITYLIKDKEIPDEIVSKYLHIYFSGNLKSKS